MMFLAVAACSILALAAGLLIVGLRGRRVDDHPLCRRCGFDLTGRPAGSTRCAECGADLTRPRAVRVGRRVRRRGALAIGALLLLAFIMPAGVIGWGRAKGVDWNRHKPGWWLVVETEGSDPVARDAALAELIGRLKAGTLSDDDLASLVGHALDEQGAPDTPWVAAWGEVVEGARAGGRLPDERWVRYLRQAIGPETLSLHIARGRPQDEIEVTVDFGPPRIARGTPNLLASVWLPLDEWPRGETPDPPMRWPRAEPRWRRIRPRTIFLHPTAGVYFDQSEDLPAAHVAPEGAGPGTYTATMPVKLQVFEVPDDAVPRRGGRRGPYRPTPADVRVETVLQLSDTWTLLPADWDPRVADPSLAGAVRAAVSVHSMMVDEYHDHDFSAIVIMDAPPANLSFAASVRKGGEEFPVGHLGARAGRRETVGYLRTKLPAVRSGDRVDLVLRADPTAAALIDGIDAYWDGELVFEGVRIR